jgi:hypothetical protein
MHWTGSALRPCAASSVRKRPLLRPFGPGPTGRGNGMAFAHRLEHLDGTGRPADVPQRRPELARGRRDPLGAPVASCSRGARRRR